jgi:segregation and condensation protein B
MRRTLDISELKPIVESLLFVSDVPLRSERICDALEVERPLVMQALGELVGEYRDAHRGFVLEEVAEGYQFRTRPEYADWVLRLTKARPVRFSQAALEALAIIAYRQPVTRAEIDYLRGVDSGGVVKTLLERHLIRILGKKDVPGKPMIYGTTREFLEFFGLRDLASLPTLKEFSELAPGELAAGEAALAEAGAEIDDGTPD